VLERGQLRWQWLEDIMKYKIYIDFDGVIWDTWPMLYKTLKENDRCLYDKMMTKTLTPEEDLAIGKVFIKHNNWDYIMENTLPIAESLDELKELYDSNMFDISILTHCNTDGEVNNKRKIINKYVPGIELIPVFKPAAKSSAVNPRGAILIDDYSLNLIDWQNAGGIAVKFTTKHNENSEFYHINSLLQIKGIIEKLEYSSDVSQNILDLAEANG
jgi:hypothetical protein